MVPECLSVSIMIVPFCFVVVYKPMDTINASSPHYEYIHTGGTTMARTIGKFRAYMRNVRSNIWNVPFFLYITKCIFGSALCYAVYLLYPAAHLSGSIMACLLVLSPDERNSLKLAYTRIGATITGGLVAMLCFFLPFSPLGCLCISIPVISVLCYLQNLGSATRLALSISAVVILQRPSEGGTFLLAATSVLAVLIGCAIALVLAFMFHMFMKYFDGSQADIDSTNNIQLVDIDGIDDAAQQQIIQQESTDSAENQLGASIRAKFDQEKEKMEQHHEAPMEAPPVGEEPKPHVNPAIANDSAGVSVTGPVSDPMPPKPLQ